MNRNNFKMIINRVKFTLLELLIVIAIISILASLLLPALKKARETATGIKCINQQKQIVLALYSYVDSANGYVPVRRKIAEGAVLYSHPGWGGSLFQNGYMTKGETYVCPSATSYKYSDKLINAKQTTHNATFDWLHYGMNMYFCDNVDGKPPFRFVNTRHPGETVLIGDTIDSPPTAVPINYCGKETLIYPTLAIDFLNPRLDNRHGIGSNVAWVDGHVQWRGNAWQQLQRASLRTHFDPSL